MSSTWYVWDAPVFPALEYTHNADSSIANIRADLDTYVSIVNGRPTFDLNGFLALAKEKIYLIAPYTVDGATAEPPDPMGNWDTYYLTPQALRSTDVSPQASKFASDLTKLTANSTATVDLRPYLLDLQAKSGAVTAYYDQAYAVGLAAVLNQPLDSGALEKNVPPVDNPDPETRYYRTTFVNDWENESAPSPVSDAIEVRPRDTVTVTVGAVPPNRDITHWRPYRSNSGSEAAAYQYTPNTTDDLGVPIATGTFTDAVPNSNLQEVCPSTIWEEPPANLRGLVGMANGIHVGFFDNVLVPSESYVPYAFPPDYRITVEWPIVGLCAWEQAVFVGTEGKPYFVHGADAASLTASLLDSNQACVSARSICATPQGVVYASPDGLCLASPAGVQVLTANHFTREEWQALNPEEMQVIEHDGVLYILQGTGGLLLDYSIDSINRFDPRYFICNGPRTASFGLTTELVFGEGDPQVAGLRLDFTVRATNDLVGVIWESVDTKDHALLAYHTDTDYRGVVWEFDIDVAPTMPVFSDPTQAISLTIEGFDEDGQAVVYYVPLYQYCDNPNDRSGRVTLDFDVIRSGFGLEDPVYAGNITRMFLSAVVTGYDPTSSAPLPEPVDGSLTLSNIVVSGQRTTIPRNRVAPGNHVLGMSTSYDDHYDVTPQRIIENTMALGYARYINHYCGMSIFPNTRWDETAGRYLVVEPGGAYDIVNGAAYAWHENFIRLCAHFSFELIQAVSYETFSENARQEWVQKDWDDNLSVTGYTPPSHLLSPCVTEGMQWLQQAAVEFASIVEPGMAVRIQVGEPWWWYNPSTLKPCIYDNATRVAFNNATGLFAPEFDSIYSKQTGTPYDEFKTFLADRLGQSVRDVRTAVQLAVPGAEVSALVFLPTIIGYGIMEEVNLPDSHYAYPNLDFFQTEAYDWIIARQMDKPPLAMDYPINTLGYPLNKIEYLAGFVPGELPVGGPTTSEVTRKSIWQRVVQNVMDNEGYGINRQYLWAYTLVMRDSITFRNTMAGFYTFFFGQSEIAADPRGTSVHDTPKVYALSMASGKMTTKSLPGFTTVYRDLMTDTIYAAVADEVHALFSAPSRVEATWTKRVTTERYYSYKLVQVDSDFTDADGAAAPVTFTVEDANGNELATATMSDRTPRPLAPFDESEIVVRITSKARITAVKVASSMKEMKQL